MVAPGQRRVEESCEGKAAVAEAAATVVRVDPGDRRIRRDGNVPLAGEHQVELAVVVVVTPGHCGALEPRQTGVDIAEGAVAIVAIDTGAARRTYIARHQDVEVAVA